MNQALSLNGLALHFREVDVVSAQLVFSVSPKTVRGMQSYSISLTSLTSF